MIPVDSWMKSRAQSNALTRLEKVRLSEGEDHVEKTRKNRMRCRQRVDVVKGSLLGRLGLAFEGQHQLLDTLFYGLPLLLGDVSRGNLCSRHNRASRWTGGNLRAWTVLKEALGKR